MKKELLLDQHLHFLSLHRGRLESSQDLRLIHSQMGEFKLAFPTLPNSLDGIPAGYTIYLPDWSEAGQPSEDRVSARAS